MYRAIGLSLLASLIATSAFAWSATGHSIVAEIAERRLTDDTRKAVMDLVEHDSLASLSTWADDHKFTDEGAQTESWHYANLDIDVTTEAAKLTEAGWSKAVSEACPTENPPRCLLSALRHQIGVLGSSANVDDRRSALKMVVHLMGDLSQPHHCAARKVSSGSTDLDRGGNRVDAIYLRDRDRTSLEFRANLHLAWDDQILDSYGYGWTNILATQIDLGAVPKDAADLSGDYIDRWARECHLLGVKSYSALPPQGAGRMLTIDRLYQQEMKPDTLASLATSGVRLAAILNETLGK